MIERVPLLAAGLVALLLCGLTAEVSAAPSPFAPASPNAPQDGGLGRFDRDLQRLVKRVKPSVVSVRVLAVSEVPVTDEDSEVPGIDGESSSGSETGTGGEARDESGASAGKTSALRTNRRVIYRSSGLIGTRSGEIMTVISDYPWEYDLDPSERQVTEVELHDGSLHRATISARDHETGITLLTLLDPPQRLRPVRFAKSVPQQGGTVVSVGAEGFALGHIAHPARGISLGSISFPRGIVTSIEAQAGDVGGMLANPEAELVGMLAFSLAAPRSIEGSPETGHLPEDIHEERNHGTTTREGTAYERAGRPELGELITSKVRVPRDGAPLGRSVAIPADLLLRIVRELRATGEMKRGALGATFQFHHPGNSDSHIGVGALVRQLTPGGTAEKAGLRVGDVIQKIDQKPIRRPKDLLWFREAVEYGEIGNRLVLSVARMENRRIASKSIRVTIGTRPEGSRGDELEEPCHPDCTGTCKMKESSSGSGSAESRGEISEQDKVGSSR